MIRGGLLAEFFQMFELELTLRNIFFDYYKKIIEKLQTTKIAVKLFPRNLNLFNSNFRFLRKTSNFNFASK